jgi:ribonuclease E
MLIDATHAEETRVVVLDGNRLEDFDVETATKKQLKGNIYLAKVVRVEPSLQAAFVEYGGGRHGFLAFSEIHPDYYQIPVADRQRLLALQAEEAREDEEDDDDEAEAPPPRAPASAPRAPRAAARLIAIDEAPPAPAGPFPDEPVAVLPIGDEPGPTASATEPPAAAPASPAGSAPGELAASPAEADAGAEPAPPAASSADPAPPEGPPDDTAAHGPPPRAQASAIPHQVTYGAIAAAELDPLAPLEAGRDGGEAPGAEAGSGYTSRDPDEENDEQVPDLPPPETIGGESDATDDVRSRRTARFLRNYRIQEVIRRRQIMLVQVVKEERGTKGAALTSYISLAGRFCVLMPNSPRGGGISRKITSAADRKRLKEITAELEIPQGMGLIVRTAGANRPKAEIRRDCEYLMRLWDDIREHTLRSVAPALIYEEASLIKRAIRDVYSRDIDEIVVDGEEGWRGAHDFMRMLMPSHARKVELWRDASQPLFSKYQVEAQLDAMLSPTVQLRSGGYLVINQAEALVAIDVNSGRSTRERGIEETAVRTNLEAADEVARQLRLRDLAGLIVIDFIDMESKKNNAAVERRLKDALKIDRARIQVGHISHFGLLEMSRQRLRPSLAETSFVACPHCSGLGHVRSIESSALHVLRAIEDEGAKGRASLIQVSVASAVIMYVLNHKRDRLADIEARTAMRVQFAADEQLVPPQVRVERLRAQLPESERPSPVVPALPAPLPEAVEAEDLIDEPDEIEAVEALATAEPADAGGSAESREESNRRRRRRRRRRGGRDAGPAELPGASGNGEDGEAEEASLLAEDADQPEIPRGAFPLVPEPVPAEAPSASPEPAATADDEAAGGEESDPARRRRGRRGGRRRRRDEGETAAEPVEAAPPLVWTGPTPADPFGGQTYDIFDLFEQQEQPDVPVLPPAPAAAVEAGPVPPQATEPVAPEPVAEVAVASPVALPPVSLSGTVEADIAEPQAAVAASAPEPAASAEARPEPVVGPAIRPLVIGQDDIPAAERKRGWWRRP